MPNDQGGDEAGRFYLEGHEISGDFPQPPSSSGPPVSLHGPPAPGTGRVFITYHGDLGRAWAHWECEERFVFRTGEYGDVLLWGLSRPATQFFVPCPLESGDPVEVFPQPTSAE